MTDPDVRVDIEAKGAEKTSAALKGVSDSITGTGRSARRADPSIKKLEKTTSKAGNEAAQLAASAKLAEKNIRAMGRAATYANIRLKALERTQKRLNRATAKSGALGVASGLGGGSGGGGVSVPGVPRIPRGGGAKPPRKSKGVQKIGTGGVAGGALIAMASKYGAIIYLISALIPALVTGIASLGAGILGLGGALAPLGGLLIAYPGYLAAVGQGFLAVKLSMAGIADGLKAMTDASMSWQEANQSMARFTGGGINKSVAKPLLRDITGLGVAFKYVGYQVQRTLIPGMRQALSVGRSMIPMLSDALTKTGTALGGVMSQIAGYLGSSRAQSLIQSILGTNTGIISSFGGAIERVLSMVLELVNAAGPMLSRMARDIGAFMGKLSGQVGAGAQNGGLARFFDSAYAAAKKVMAVIGPLLKALWNVMKIGKPLGDALLASWGTMAKNFQTFTESAGGVQKITAWFAYMKPILWEIGYLIRDIAKVLGAWSMAPGFIEMSQMIRRDLLPVIQEFVTTTANLMLPLMLDVVKAVLQIIIAWQSASVTFVVFKALTGYLSALGKVLSDTSGWISKFLTALLTLLLAMKAGKIAVAAYLAVTKLLAPAFHTAAVAMRAYSIATAGTGSAATKAAVGVRALGGALKGALISTGVGALVVAAGLFLDAMMSMDQAKQDAIARDKEWAESMYGINGAIKDNARALAIQNMGKEGLFTYLDKMTAITTEGGTVRELGVSYADLVDAVIQGGPALDEVVGKLKTYGEATNYVTDENGQLIVKYAEQGAQATILAGILGNQNSALTAQGKIAYTTAKAMGTLGMSEEDAQNKIDGLPSATATAARGMDALTVATMRTVNAFQMLKGIMENIDYNIGLRGSGRSLAKTLKENGKALGFGAKGDANRSAVLDILKTASERSAAFNEAGNTPQAIKALNKGTRLLIKTIADSLFNGNMKSARNFAKELVGPKVWRQVTKARRNLVVKERLEQTRYDTLGMGSGQVPKQAFGPVASRGDLAAGARYAAYAEKDKIPPLVAANDANTDATVLNTTALNNLKATLGMLPGSMGYPIPAGTPTPPGSPARTGGGGRNYDFSWRWAGGAVSAGSRAMVGEIGPEGFIDSAGRFSILGKNGPEVKSFASSGYVVPNSQLAGALASRTAANGARSSSGEAIGGDGINITIGDIHQANEFDVVQAVKRGLREAEREKRERS